MSQKPLPKSTDTSLGIDPIERVGHQQVQTFVETAAAQTAENTVYEQALGAGSTKAQEVTQENTDADREHASNLAGVQYYSALLQKLLNFIAHGDNESVLRVVSTIRAGASYKEIFDFIDHQLAQDTRSNEGEEVVAIGGQ